MIGVSSFFSLTSGLSSELGDSPIIGGLLIVVTIVALLLHPRKPEWAIGVVAVVLTIVLFVPGLPESVEVAAVACYVSYLASAYSSRRLRRVWLVWLLVGTNAAVVSRFFTTELPTDSRRQLIIAVGAAFGAACAVVGFFWMLGTRRRQRLDRLTQLAEQAEIAGVVERTRIAREMHDIIAHNLSGVIALADGARYAASKDPQIAVEALNTISDTSRQALQQMRGLLSVLRDDSGRDLTTPGRGELEGLFADARRSGLDLEVHGADTLPKSMPELAHFTTYRLIQEMLTNMLKHADPRRGQLTIAVTGKSLTIEAINPVLLTDREEKSGRFGLVGMRERVRAHGGRLSTNKKDNTFHVTAELPL